MHPILPALVLSVALPAHGLFINELHYDNAGTDSGEGVEIAALAGTDLSGYVLQLYNGGDGSVYRSIGLKGVVDDEQAGFGSLFFATGALQNGAADGLALVDPLGAVVQFLSYEGALFASSGAAAGMTSTDIGVEEGNTTAEGTSLQLVGTGSEYADFSWLAGAAASYGSLNSNQQFSAVPLPGALPMLAAGLAVLGAARRRRP